MDCLPITATPALLIQIVDAQSRKGLRLIRVRRSQNEILMAKNSNFSTVRCWGPITMAAGSLVKKEV